MFSANDVAITALERARACLRHERNVGAAELNSAMRELANALGTQRPEIGTIRAITAVVDKLENPMA